MSKVGKILRRFLVQPSAQRRVSYSLWRLDRTLCRWINWINSKDGDFSLPVPLVHWSWGEYFPIISSLNLPYLTCPSCLSSYTRLKLHLLIDILAGALGTTRDTPSKAFPSLVLVSSTAWASPNSEVLQHCSLWWFSTSVVFWFQICFFYHILVWPWYFYFVLCL